MYGQIWGPLSHIPALTRFTLVFLASFDDLLFCGTGQESGKRSFVCHPPPTTVTHRPLLSGPQSHYRSERRLALRMTRNYVGGTLRGMRDSKTVLTPSDGQGSFLNITQVFVSTALAKALQYSLKSSTSQEFGLLQRWGEEDQPVWAPCGYSNMHLLLES